MFTRRGIVFGVVCIASIFNIASASGSNAWSGFQVIIWQDKTARQHQSLRLHGVTAARFQADRARETRASARQKVYPIVQAGLRPYVENIVTDFYSAYNRWSADKPPNAAFLNLQREAADNPDQKFIFVRQPGLSDPTALGRIAKRLRDIVRIYARFRPIFFNLGGETGIADLSAAWDFDSSDSSLSHMRRWLQERYGTLSAPKL